MKPEEFLAKWEDNDSAQLLLDDLVINAYLDMASNVNNAGMWDQLDFLATDGFDLEELDAQLSRGGNEDQA